MRFLQSVAEVFRKSPAQDGMVRENPFRYKILFAGNGQKRPIGIRVICSSLPLVYYEFIENEGLLELSRVVPKITDLRLGRPPLIDPGRIPPAITESVAAFASRTWSKITRT